MKPYLLLIVAGAALALVGTKLYQRSSLTHLSLYCAEPIHDFGEMWSREARDREHQFILTNPTNRLVRIIHQEASCGCTSVNISSQEVPPKGSVLVRARADWVGKPGAQEVFVLLKTDEPTQPTLQLVLRGLVKSPVVLIPKDINFGLLKRGERRSRTVEVAKGVGAGEFKVLGVSATDSRISIEPIDNLPSADPLSGSRGRYSITLINGGKSGSLREKVVFRTDSQLEPELTLYLAAELVGELKSVPSTLVLSGVAAQVVSGNIVVECPPDLADSIEAVEDSGNPKKFQISKFRTARAAAVTFTVTLPKDSAEPGIYRSALRVRSGMDELSIPIVAIINPKGR